MSDPVVPTAPAAAPAVAPTTTAPSTPAAAPAAPRDPETGRFAPKGSTLPDAARVAKPQVSAKKALGFEDDPVKLANKEIKEFRKKNVTRIAAIEESEPVEPVAETPEVAVAEPAVPAAAPAPVVPAKIKIGEKEYTEEELKAELAKSQQPAQVAPAKAPEAAKPPTPEELAAQEKETKAREQKWTAEFAQNVAADLQPMTAQEWDAVLGGGEEAVKALHAVRARDVASAVLQARKSLAPDINKRFEAVLKQMQPLIEQQQQLEVYTTEQAFSAKHLDFKPGWALEKARAVANAFVAQHPQWVESVTREQFIDAVAQRTDEILKREWKSIHGNEDWRAGLKAIAASQQAPATVPQQPPITQAANAPVGSTVTPAVPATVPAAPRVKPPAANTPAGGSAASGKDFHKSVAHSLRG